MSEALRQWKTQADGFRKYAREILDLLPIKKGHLLDVGCGLGWVVAEAKKRGFLAMGIDPKKDYVRIGRRYLRANLKVASLENFTTKKKFDVVVAKHVLEHIVKPGEFLAKTRHLLRPGGYLVVACPNIRSLMAWIFRQRWYGLCPSEHVWQFTPKILRLLLEENGFKIEKVVVNSLDYQPPGWKGVVFSLLVAVANFLKIGDQVVIVCRLR